MDIAVESTKILPDLGEVFTIEHQIQNTFYFLDISESSIVPIIKRLELIFPRYEISSCLKIYSFGIWCHFSMNPESDIVCMNA
ncbi:MAG TPA: hypothetical protein DIC34_14530 [Treponema sp.]|nr:hypothetical protein [Treponema sp.]